MAQERETSELLKELQDSVSYNPETGEMFWKKRRNRINAGDPAFAAVHQKGYLFGRFHYKRFFAHRIAWALYFGEWPTEYID